MDEQIVLVIENDDYRFYDFLINSLIDQAKIQFNNKSNIAFNDVNSEAIKIVRTSNGKLRTSPELESIDVLSDYIAIICAAGGVKWFLNLLKTWVEERKGRKIIITIGSTELEIFGGISEKKLKRVISLFEEKFGQSRNTIIKP